MTNPTTSVFDRVVKALKEETHIDRPHLFERDARPSSRFVQDLGFDSLDCVMATMAIEDEFGIEISDDEANECHDIQSAVNLVEKKLALQPESAPVEKQRELSPPKDLAQQLWASEEIMSFNARVGLTMENLVELIGLVDKMRSKE